MNKTIISGVIVLIIGSFVVDPIKEFVFSEEKNTQSKYSVVDLSKEDMGSVSQLIVSDKRNKFLIQCYSTIEIYDGDLSITLNNMIEYSNQNIHIVVSRVGRLQKNFEQMSLGDKVIYEDYEITFINTQTNITTQDIWLKVVLLNKKR